MCLKQKRLIEKGGFQLPQPGALITSADNSWPPPLPFHTAPKIPQPNIFTLFIHFYVRECVCMCVCVRALLNESVCECVCESLWVSVFIRVRYVGNVWICSSEELLELYGYYLYILFFIISKVIKYIVGQVARAARRLTTGWTARVRSRVSEEWRFFFTPSCPDLPWGPLNLL